MSNGVNELPEPVAEGLAAAIMMAQQLGLIRFPRGEINHEQAKRGVELVVGVFVHTVEQIEPGFLDRD